MEAVFAVYLKRLFVEFFVCNNDGSVLETADENKLRKRIKEKTSITPADSPALADWVWCTG